jgi:UDP-2,3-diacylglucosamine hydrolase
MQTLFLSDLHLSEKTPDITSYFKKFIHYCQNHINEIERIFILGDFFEFWVGDDYQSEYSQDIFLDLTSISKNATIQNYFMPGNRDFLLGKGATAGNSFEQQTGFTIIDDPYCLVLAGDKILLTHGDILCTDDIAYQKMRQMMRNDLWQKEILSKSVSERIQIALAARKQSEQQHSSSQNTLANQTEYIMDVNQAAVNKILQQNQCKTIIHGHTHRPDTHHFELDTEQAKRIVLADWHKQGSFLRYENQHFSTVFL